MLIDGYSYVDANIPLRRNNKDLEQSAYGPDVNFFASMLERPSIPSPIKPSSNILPLLAEATRPLEASMKRLGKVFGSTGKNINFEQFKTLPSELGNAQLSTQLLVRSLGKTTQCIDKICNLQ